jgi:uncharacterized membrane protein required for colicin V production
VNWLDGAIIVLVIWFTFSAFQAGFIRETVTIVGAILGVVLAGLYYRELADDVLVFIDNNRAANLVAFGVIAGAVALAGQMLALVLKPTVDFLQLGIFDQLAGAIVGFAKAMVFVQAFLILFVTYPRWDMVDTIDNSLFGSMILDNTAYLVNVLPQEFEGAVDTFKARL